MKLKLPLLFLSFLICSVGFGQTPGLAASSKYLNVSVGASNLGIPVYATADIPLSMDYQFIGMGISRQSQKEVFDYYWLYGTSYTWKISLTGIHLSYNYDLAEFLDGFLPDEIQVYAGAQMDYYILKSKLTDHSGGPVVEYSGTQTGGFGVSGLAGFRYFMGAKRKLAVNVVLNGGSRSSGGRIGVSYNLGE